MRTLEDFTDSNRTDHQIAKESIIKELRKRKGKDNAISSSDLAEGTPVSASTVRDLIPEIRREFRIPVVGSNSGFYLINEQEEFLRVMESIEGEIETRKQTRRELASVWNSKVAK